MHVLMTANTAWNILNFRLPLIEAAIDRGWKVIILAPWDASVERLKNLGCEYRPVIMGAGGVNPLSEVASTIRFYASLRRINPDVSLAVEIF